MCKCSARPEGVATHELRLPQHQRIVHLQAQASDMPFSAIFTAFTPSAPMQIRPTTRQGTLTSVCRRRPRVLRLECSADGAQVPDSPAALVESWRKGRSVKLNFDLSRHFVTVLFLSNNCQRACVAEKVLTKLAEQHSIGRRLLILSAGIHSNPGDLLPPKLVISAGSKDIDLTEERPCASFQISDLDCYDFVVVVDHEVKDKLTHMAEASAQSGGQLYEWERKIRLLCDFEGSLSTQQSATEARKALDVPPLNATSGFEHAFKVIRHACESVMHTLITAGL